MNDERYLPDTLRCMFAQTFQDWELLFVDDGSTDGSRNILERVTDPRVRLLPGGVNRGRPFRYNQITGEARGAYISRYDSDDLIHPRKLAEQVAVLDSNTEIDVVGCGMLSLDRDDQPIGWRSAMTSVVHDQICGRWPIGHVALCHGGIMGRREWFLDNPYDESYRTMAEDLALWAKTMHHSQFSNVPACHYYYRDMKTQTLRKYLLTKMAALRINWSIDSHYFPLTTVTTSIALNALRILSYAIGTPLGLSDWLVAKRGQPVRTQDLAEFRQALQLIRSTKVPGLDT
jgi:glycosyltransferase involved in cell wall biosynthesis